MYHHASSLLTIVLTATAPCVPVEVRTLGAASPLSARLVEDLRASMTDHFHPPRSEPESRTILSVTRDGLTVHMQRAGQLVPMNVIAAVAQSNHIAVQYVARIPLVRPLELIADFRPACTTPIGTTPATTTGHPFFEFQVEKTAMPRPGTSQPVYPPELRKQKIPGEVLAQFVIGLDGRAEMSTFKVLKSSDPRFTAAVRDAVTSMRFVPAEIEGRPVRQLIQQPFVFSVP